MKRPKDLEEQIAFTRNRLAAYRHVLNSEAERLRALEQEREAVEERIFRFREACAAAPLAIARLEKELAELELRDMQRLAVGGSAKAAPTRIERMIRRREQLLRRLAEVEASLPPEARQ